MAQLSSEAIEASRLASSFGQLEPDDEPDAAGGVRSPALASMHVADAPRSSSDLDDDDPVGAAAARAGHSVAQARGLTPQTRPPPAFELPSSSLAADATGAPTDAGGGGGGARSPASRTASPLRSAPPPASPKPWHHQAHAMHGDAANSVELAQVCAMLQEAIAMRQRYMKGAPSAREPSDTPASPVPHYAPFEFPPSGPPPRSQHVFEFRNGVMVVWKGTDLPSLLQVYEATHRVAVDFHAFSLDMGRLHDICAAGPVYSFCVRRLALLESRYKLHTMEQEGAELAQMRANPHRDYYNCRKVDTHIHLAAAMNQKHLLRFIKRKMKVEPDEPVIAKNGRTLTLREVCAELRLSPYDINLDSLGMHADASTFRRFDKFNLKYNPLGDASLREIFIKTDNYMNGRYLAELTKELFADLEESKYVNTEYRLSIYGRDKHEWRRLAEWVVGNQLWSPNNRWLIQVPRLFHLYRANGSVEHFEDFLSNLFAPLFEATRDPAAHRELHLFLQQVVGFDCVDDESKPDGAMPLSEADWARGGYPSEPRVWTLLENPHYGYYVYHLYANLHVLNQFRTARGFNTFEFRPHSGEAGELSHLHATFACAHAINHGLMLRRSPPLQYLWYLTQIGIAMSPLSNNMLFCELARNPFPLFFVRGLNVCLSTDDPLMFHYTKEPLMEEYCIARHTWQLSPVDLSEAFRASVLHSSFEKCVKAYWLGQDFWRPGAAGNDITRTNVPDIRLAFREQAHREEMQAVYATAAASAPLQTAYSAASAVAPARGGGGGGPRGSLLNNGNGPKVVTVDTLSRAHEAAAKRGAAAAAAAAAAGGGGGGGGAPSAARLMPNAQDRRRSNVDALIAQQAAVTRLAGTDERADGGGDYDESEPLVLGLKLSHAVALGVGACAFAASAFALGAAVAGVVMTRGGGRRRRGGGGSGA